MTIFDALYGSQYYDLEKKGYDTNKGRLYGNLLFAVTIMIYLFVILIVMNLVSEDFTKDLTRFLRNIFGHSTGKAIGKIIAIPLVAIIYLVVMLLFGSKKSYEKRSQTYLKAPQKEKDDAIGKMVGVFIVGLLLLTILSISSLFL